MGLQILFDSSEEGKEPGLGIIPGIVRRFHSEVDLTIPHMGWNQLEFTQAKLPLWQQLPPFSLRLFRPFLLCGSGRTRGEGCNGNSW